MYNNQPEIQLPNGWEYVELLGKGSFGRVYRAKRTIGQYTEWAAVKHISIPSDQEELDAICAELGTKDNDAINAYISANLEIILDEYFVMKKLHGHASIVDCNDIQQIKKANGIGYDVYIWMELLDSLSNRIIEKKTDRSETVQMGKDICQALSVLKSKGIVHRDIKPQNIFANDQGHYKLGDFGASRNIQGTSTMMSMKGTYSYMPPEIIQGHPAGFTSDIYSLGLVMYRLMNKNRLPFTQEDDINGMRSVEQSNSRRLSGEKLPLPSDADEELGRIILKACAYNPKDRWQTPEEMYQALVDLTGNDNKKRNLSKHQSVKLALAAIAVLIVAAVAYTAGHVVNNQSNEKRIIEVTAIPESNETAIAEGTAATESNEKLIAEATPVTESNEMAITEKAAATGPNETQVAEDTTIPESNKTAIAESPAVAESNEKLITESAPATESNEMAITEKAAATVTNEILDAEETIKPESNKTAIAESPAATESNKKLIAEATPATELNEIAITEDTAVTVSNEMQIAEDTAIPEQKDDLKNISDDHNYVQTGKEDYEYGLRSDGSVQINKYLGQDEYILIPETIDSKPVTAIGIRAFEFNSSLKAVRIPDSVRGIDEMAFVGCANLVSINLPDSITRIDDGAFGSCHSLTSITIPDSVKFITGNPFHYCNNLADIQVSEKQPVLRVIDHVLFSKDAKTLICYPPALQNASYNVPDGVKKIGESAFTYCPNLTSIHIPDTVEAMESYAITDCSNLRNINLPNRLTSFDNGVLSYCVNLHSIIVSSNHPTFSIENNVLFHTTEERGKKKKSLVFYPPSSTNTTYSIPSDVIEIESYAFVNCEYLETIIIPDGVKTISVVSFEKCSNLKSVTIPRSVNYISDSAFYGNTNLVLKVYRDSYAAQFCEENKLAYTFIK